MEKDSSKFSINPYWMVSIVRRISMEIKIDNAVESLIKTAKPQGNGALVLVPKRWIGKRVQVILLSEDD
jgi:putative transposon-encoded protein